MHEFKDDMSNSEYLCVELIRYVPEVLPFLTQIKEEEAEIAAEIDQEETEANVYTLISVGFVHSVLVPALEGGTGEAQLLERCAELIEILVTSTRSQIRDATVIRIIETIAGHNDYWRRISAYVGPATRSRALMRRGGVD